MADIEVSRFRFYSIGIAAQNKNLKERSLEVYPIEPMAFGDGEIADNLTEEDVVGVASDGSSFTDKVRTTPTIKAQWLRFGHDNRLTAPDIRRGERVILYQFGDADQYYWMTLMDDSRLRRLETTIYGWSGSAVEGDPVDHDHLYYLEVSTHKGLVSFHTSKVNGEFCIYDIQINTKDGVITIQDDIGNEFYMNSAEHRLYMKNTDGSFYDMNKTVLDVYTQDSINFKTKNLTVNASDGITMEGGNTIGMTTSSMSAKASSSMNLNSSGSMNLKSSGGTQMTSSASVLISSPATSIS